MQVKEDKGGDFSHGKISWNFTILYVSHKRYPVFSSLEILGSSRIILLMDIVGVGKHTAEN